MRWLLLALILPFPALAETWTGPAYVIDGDTLAIDRTRLRLVGIDAFETAQNCQKAGKEYACGLEARFVLTELIGGRSIRCESDKRDRYARPLVHCWIGDLDLNQTMVRMGWALAEYSEEYRQDEASARESGAGAWRGTFVRPRVWRKPPF